MNFQNTSISDELKGNNEFFKKLEIDLQELATDSTFLGIVVSNEDPDFLGRCKIRVFGLFECIFVSS